MEMTKSELMEKSCKGKSCLVFSFNVILQVLLFIIFLLYFGIPSVEKYLKKQTIVLTSEEITNGMEAPAITFVAFKENKSMLGWKSVNETLNFESFSLVRHCHGINLTDLETCIRSDTIDLGDFLKETRLGIFEEKSTSIPSKTSSPMWTEDMAASFLGRYFTLKLSRNISSQAADNIIIFGVNASYQFHIWVHDDNFFIANLNHFGLPSKLWKIPPNKLVGEGLYYEITLTKHKKLNIQRQPCEEDPTYSFFNCIQSCKSLTTKSKTFQC